MSDIRHGTPSCYTDNKCRRPECRAAWAAYMRKYRKVQSDKRKLAKAATP